MLVWRCFAGYRERILEVKAGYSCKQSIRPWRSSCLLPAKKAVVDEAQFHTWIVICMQHAQCCREVRCEASEIGLPNKLGKNMCNASVTALGC